MIIFAKLGTLGTGRFWVKEMPRHPKVGDTILIAEYNKNLSAAYATYRRAIIDKIHPDWSNYYYLSYR